MFDCDDSITCNTNQRLFPLKINEVSNKSNQYIGNLLRTVSPFLFLQNDNNLPKSFGKIS